MSRLLSTLLVQLRSAAQPRVDRVSDAELLGRFVHNRDAAAFELLFWRHGPMIWGVCQRLLGDSPDAEDVYQAVFVVLARKAGSIGRGEALAGWLHRVARRTALNVLTAQRRRSVHEQPMTDLPEVPAHDSPLRQTMNRELKDLLDEELLHLPEKFRQPVLLCDLEQRSHEEAAAVLNCPLGTLNSRLARGRQRLKERLIRRGVALTAVSAVAAPQAVSAAALDAVLRMPSAPVWALADGTIHALTMSAMKKIAASVILCCLLFAGLAYGAAVAAKKATTRATVPGAEATADGADAKRAETVSTEQEAFITGKIVDEANKPVAGATVKAVGLEKSRPATSGADGSFRLALGYPAGDWLRATVVAEDGVRLGYSAVYQEKPEPVKVVVKPAHAIRVVVTDGAKKPVAGAEICFLGDMAPLVDGRTDAEGRWSGRVPADVKEWSVFARKAKIGFDYAVSQDHRAPDSKPKPIPAQLSLSLDGARTLRVKTVDREGKAIAGVKVGSWYLQKPGHEGDINLSGMMARWPATGKDGVMVLDWLPDRVVNGIPIMARANDYYMSDPSNVVKQDKPTDEMTITLLPLERISGRVSHPGGQAAAGIQVRVEGQGAGHNHFQRMIRTGPDGRFSLKVYSEQSYIVAVTDERWSAPYRGGLVVRAGKPVDGVDFVLGPATRVHGRVTVGKDNRPVAKTYIRVDINLGEIPPELRKTGDRAYHEIAMSFHAETDKDGRYDFRLGPGTYKLFGPALKETVPLAIPATNPPAQIAHDFRMPRPETIALAGKVVDDTGKPLAGTLVDGRYAANTAHWFQYRKTDAQGRFSEKRASEPMVLYARSADRTLAGLLRIDAEAPKATIVVGPVATASGRLLDLKGQPLAGKKLPYGIRIYQGETANSPFMDSFGGVATTDANGRFNLEGLIPGQAYELTLQLDEHSSRNVKRVLPKNSLQIHLGDLRVDPEPHKRYVPPTPAERTAKAFAPAKAEAPRQRLDRVLVEAAREYTRPLLLFGQPKDPACVELFRLFSEAPPKSDDETEQERAKRPLTAYDLRWEFELASLDTDKPDVRKFAGEIGVPAGKGQPPVLAVLNADGALAATFPLVLDSKQKLDGAPLTVFLAKHKLPTRDAEKMLADTMRKAKTEGKIVFFIASASWCGPCRLLSRFVAARRDVFDKHYVFVKLDISRDKHARAVRKRIQGENTGGVPWYAILDADGKMRGNSSVPDDKGRPRSRNIGFPSDAEDVERFLTLIERTAPRMTKEEIGGLRKELADR